MSNLSPDSFSSDTKMVLVNAIYFKCPWKYPFEINYTTKAQFKLTNGQNTEVDMMVLEDDFPSGDVQQLNAKIVVLPYKVGRELGAISIFALLCDYYSDICTHRGTVSACTCLSQKKIKH